MKKFLAIVLAMMMVMVTACSNKPNGAVAKIGKEYIYQKDVDKVMEDYKQYYGQDIFNPNTEQGKEALKQIKPKIIDMLINEKIANKLMKDKKIEVSDKEVQAEVDKLQKQLGGADKFKEQLKKENMTEQALKEQIEKQLKNKKLSQQFEKDFKPSDKEIKDEFDKNIDTYTQYNADHILFSGKDAKGKNLDASKLKAKSEDPSAKQNSGKLGDFLSSTMVKEFSDALKKMKPGEVSKPVKTEFGYHIIKLNSKVTELDKMTDANKQNVKTAISNKIIQEKVQKEFEKQKKDMGVKIY
ncbi:MAG: SurA N-terminal domain-containing protein [Finegoldia magna]|nr:SurA N-terminal domain-containing protein [Finegoldia magna]